MRFSYCFLSFPYAMGSAALLAMLQTGKVMDAEYQQVPEDTARPAA